MKHYNQVKSTERQPQFSRHFWRLAFVLLASATSLSACNISSDSGNPTSSSSELSGEWVSTSDLFANPRNYLEKSRLRFYLTEISHSGKPSNDFPDHLTLYSGDTRLNSNPFALSVALTPTAAKKWEAARLEEDYVYGVTFSGSVRPLGHTKVDWYVFLADSFEINDETTFADLSISKIDDQYRPKQKLELPRPTTIKDSRRLKLLSKDYANSLIRFDLTFSASDLQSNQEGKAYILTDDFYLAISDEITRSLVDKKSTLISAHVIGKVENQYDKDGRLIIQSQSLRIKREF